MKNNNAYIRFSQRYDSGAMYFSVPVIPAAGLDQSDAASAGIFSWRTNNQTQDSLRQGSTRPA
eukprot:5967833-Pyramimonas_sp.AAC.3